MKLRIFSIALLFLTMLAGPAFALTLQEARSAGLVGEKTDGYIAAVKPSPDVTALVESVNTQRRQEYARIAKEKGQPADVVARLAAEQIINNLSPGSMYQAADGSWKKK